MEGDRQRLIVTADAPMTGDRRQSGSRPAASAARTANRCTRTSSAIGSRVERSSRAPVRSTSAANAAGSGPSAHTSVVRPAALIGPWRYSIAGYDSVHAWAASRSLSAASFARPTLHPSPRNTK